MSHAARTRDLRRDSSRLHLSVVVFSRSFEPALRWSAAGRQDAKGQFVIGG